MTLDFVIGLSEEITLQGARSKVYYVGAQCSQTTNNDKANISRLQY